jgi:TRAP-type uncharacterized transport system substrate-binding protein
LSDRSPSRKNRSIRALIFRGLIAAILLSILFVQLVGPPLPREIRIYTGPERSSFHEDGIRYAEVLARHGIEARLVETDGSLENLDSLVNGTGPRVGFGEAALINMYQASMPEDSALNLGLVSLGALYLEPFWVFALSDRRVEEEASLGGLVVFPGREGSGTRVLADALMRANGLTDVEVYQPEQDLSEEDLVELFGTGESSVEAIFAMGNPMAPAIRHLLLDRRLRPLSFDRSEAYDRRYPFLTAVTLPEGTVDLELNVPDRELKLVASSIQLVTTNDLSPVLVDALLDAASEVHQEASLFSVRGSYPNGDPASLPLDPTAERFYSEGFSKWRSYVPFWLATWLDRFAVAFGALAALGFFLSVLPRVVAWPFGLLLNRMSNRIVKVEQRLSEPEARAELLAELESIDADSVHLWVPPTERVAYLEFRQLIDDVRARVEALPDVMKAAGGSEG